jgi:hypothetical protein
MATQRWLGWRGVAAVVALFATSRLGWWLAGIRFDASPVDWYWQILDLDLLRDRLAESLWFLHAQPPGFNALIGVAATLGEPGAVLRWVFLGLGALLAVALADALRRLSWSVPEAVAAAVLLANGLPWVVTEHWLFYDFPCTVLLGLCGWALLRIADDWRLGVSVFAGSAAALSLIRSLFHPLWMVMALAMMVWAAPTAARRRAGIVAVAALLLVGGVVVKNGARVRGLGHEFVAGHEPGQADHRPSGARGAHRPDPERRPVAHGRGPSLQPGGDLRAGRRNHLAGR